MINRSAHRRKQPNDHSQAFLSIARQRWPLWLEQAEARTTAPRSKYLFGKYNGHACPAQKYSLQTQAQFHH